MATGLKNLSNQNKTSDEKQQEKREKTRKLPPRDSIPLQQAQSLNSSLWMVGFILVDQRKTFERIIQKKMTMGRSITKKHSEYTSHVDLSNVGALDKGVSRIHAVLHVYSNCVSLQDLSSTNGTFLNGYRLESFTNIPLQDNDLIELGKLKLQVAFLHQMPD